MDNEVTPSLVISSSMSYDDISANPNEWFVLKLMFSQVFRKTSSWIFTTYRLQDVHEKPIIVAFTQSNEGEIILSNEQWLLKMLDLVK